MTDGPFAALGLHHSYFLLLCDRLDRAHTAVTPRNSGTRASFLLASVLQDAS